ncbi:cora-like Mg2+ transporter protein-domain-containing protein [Geopyxis carbonaria]|nr:cora-like Mg2+ transporter protein-domain-containing protein [Geopyxis carbonaria]
MLLSPDITYKFTTINAMSGIRRSTPIIRLAKNTRPGDRDIEEGLVKTISPNLDPPNIISKIEVDIYDVVYKSEGGKARTSRIWRNEENGPQSYDVGELSNGKNIPKRPPETDNSKSFRWIHFSARCAYWAEHVIRGVHDYEDKIFQHHTRDSFTHEKDEPVDEPYILSGQFWGAKQIRTENKPLQSYMDPYCGMLYSGRYKDSDKQLCIYLPYLHWEYKAEAQGDRFHEIFSKGKTYSDDSAITGRKYETKNCSIFFYKNISLTNSQRPSFQNGALSGAIADGNFSGTEKVVIKAQLWVWITNDSTMYTAFDSRRHDGSKEGSRYKHTNNCACGFADINSRVQYDIDRSRALQQCYENPFEMAALVVYHAVTALFSLGIRDGNDRLDVRENMRKKLFSLNKQTKELLDKFVENPEDEEDALNTQKELKLLRRATALEDEIKGMLEVLVDQKKVLKAFKEKAGDKKGKLSERTKHIIQETIHKIERTYSLVTDLKDEASRTNEFIRKVLDIKQQNAGLIEARYSSRLGRVTIVFTVVTIIFLPLSVCTSVFGMNIREWGDGIPLKSFTNIAVPLSFLTTLLAAALGVSAERFRGIRTRLSREKETKALIKSEDKELEDTKFMWD